MLIYCRIMCPKDADNLENGPGHVKTCLMPYVNNKGADQPAHPLSLMCTFVVHCLDIMVCILAISKVSRY